MDRRRLAVLWLVSSVVLAALTAWGVLYWHISREHRPAAGRAAVESEEHFHAWVHEHLQLTPQQEAALHEAEQGFATKRRALREALRAAGETLRTVILRDRADSPAVQDALQKLAGAQTALQQAALSHLFAMADRLDPPQREKLLHWLHDSLQPPP